MQQQVSTTPPDNERSKGPFAIFSAIGAFWQQRSLLGESTLQRKEAAFLPAALEIQKTPPRPIGRWVIYLIMALFAFVICWACLGRVNIVSVADGQVIPSSRIKQIQPYERGVISKIHVKEGDVVKQGSLLLSLDTTLTQADVTSLAQQIQELAGQLAANKALMSLLNVSAQDGLALTPELAWQQSANTFSQLRGNAQKLHQQWFMQQWLQYQAEGQKLQHTLQSRHQEKRVSEQTRDKWAAILPLITARVDALATLAKKQLGGQSQFLELEQQRVEIAQDLAVEQARLATFDSTIGEVKTQLEQLKYSLKVDILSRLSQLQNQFDSTLQNLNKARDLNTRQLIRSPVDGVVQQLMVSTIGGVVTPAQQLMLIVPEQDQLEAEVFLENKDIGFVHEGQVAEVKLHTFPFTRYGIVEGEVIHISDDAIEDEKRGAIFAMRIRLKQTSLMVEGREINLKPGMTLTAEVQTGKRRLIEFFLAPLLRYKNESIRER